MKKIKVFIGPAESGKTKQANEIAEKYKKNEVVFLDGRHWSNHPFFFEECNGQTKLLVIDEVRTYDFLGKLVNVSNVGLRVDRMYKDKLVIHPEEIIIIFDSMFTRDRLPFGSSFTERFEVIQFPLNNTSPKSVGEFIAWINELPVLEISDELYGKLEELKCAIREHGEKASIHNAKEYLTKLELLRAKAKLDRKKSKSYFILKNKRHDSKENRNSSFNLDSLCFGC